MTDWKQELGSFFKESEAAQEEEKLSDLARFISDVAGPAFQQIAAELEKHGREVIMRMTASSAAVIVRQNGNEEITYRIQGRTFPNGVLPYAEVRFRERKGLKFIRVEDMVRSGNADYTIGDITQDEVIRSFLGHYKRHVRTD
jgi:hypothetical protein